MNKQGRFCFKDHLVDVSGWSRLSLSSFSGEIHVHVVHMTSICRFYNGMISETTYNNILNDCSFDFLGPYLGKQLGTCQCSLNLWQQQVYILFML